MTPGISLYRFASGGLDPFVPWAMARRSARGKEDPDRLNERLARDLPPRPKGQLIWFHGASLGECKLLMMLSKALETEWQDAHCLFTFQTLAAADVLQRDIGDIALLQLAPVDTPRAAARFIDHWTPDLCIFAEGEIWPNLLNSARSAGCATALVNARMTEKSIKGWKRWPTSAERIFKGFQAILAADRRTGDALS
ncbi:MAG: glycosyltransferase N-terminal domain-containing protein, partial [Pseudomonadota bacterium]